MRLALNKEQWDKLCANTEHISDFPATVGNFIVYFASKKELGRFDMVYDPKKDIFGVWYENELNKFEAKELIDAMFNLFCHLEGI
jgi:hypothetical protein